jgi:L-arabinose isomerase
MAKMDINDLKASISKMSDDELMSLIKDIRTSRRTPKTNSSYKSKQSKAATKASTAINLDAALKNLSPDALDTLINKLEAIK